MLIIVSHGGTKITKKYFAGFVSLWELLLNLYIKKNPDSNEPGF